MGRGGGSDEVECGGGYWLGECKEVELGEG